MSFEEFLRQFPIPLSTQQKEAVQASEGPVLLLAVPGSGKTTVLVARLGYMIFCRGIAPESILTVTYTVAATRDMAERFASFFGDGMASRLEFRTINGICAKIISYCARRIGKEPFRLITDEAGSSGILSAIYQKAAGDWPTEAELKNIRALITYIKNSMLSPEEIRKIDEKEDLPVSAIYEAYCRWQRAEGVMDYDDQMIYAFTMLRKMPEVLEHFQEMYPYICVDEAQDTSKIQHAILKMLSAKHDNLFMVGDEDQSIYGFRAAYPEALLHFEKDHEGARVLLMEENFRSAADIVEAADHFIQKNVLRHPKMMRPARNNRTEIRKIALKGRRAQYKYLLKAAENCRTETAVLYRNNESAVPLVDLLERHGVPYRIRNAELGFFTHRTVMDIKSVIRLAENPFDTDSFLAVYYKLRTYLSKADAQRIAEAAQRKNLPVLDAGIRDRSLNPYTVRNLKALKTHFENMQEENGSKALNRIINFMGYAEYLERAGISDGRIRILRMIALETDSAGELLARIDELYEIFRTKENDRSCPFILSTIHASKGLEYDTVYLLDVADGIFPESVPENPGRMSEEERKAFEEERRIFYVGATRAKNNLSVFTTPGNSIFSDQLFAGVKEKAAPEKEKTGQNGGKEPFVTSVDELGEGLIVRHKRFGIGAVREIDEGIVRIVFEEGEKAFLTDIMIRNRLLRIVG